MINVGDLQGRLSLKDEFTKVLTDAKRKTEEFKNQFTAAMKAARDANKDFASRMKASSDTLDSAGRALAGVSIAAALAITGVVKVTSDFESSFAGVRKTVNATEPELQALSNGFRRMATEIPVSVNELHSIGEAAGQLGIQTKNILGFTRVMADLGVATNLTSQDAATQLARLANITQMSQKDFDRLGSTVVSLGNNFATTEAEIVAMSMRIAGAGSQIGLSEAQILAVGAALSSVGIEAEAGGSAISKVMIDMAASVAEGGERLAQFADAANMSSAAFAQAFREDSAGALNAFITGLGSLESRGKEVLTVLADMGIEEVRMRDALLRASGAGDLLTRSLSNATQAWKDNTALTKEAEQRYATFASQVTILWNKIKEVAVEIGLSLLPTLKDMIGTMDPLIGFAKTLAEGFASLPAPVRIAIAAVTGLVAALAPLLLVAGQVAFSISTLAGAGVTGAAIIAFGKFALIAAGVAAALYGGGKLIYALGEATGMFEFIGKVAASASKIFSDFMSKAASPVWNAFKDMLHEVGQMARELWSAFVELMTPTGDMNDALGVMEGALKLASGAAQIFVGILVDQMKNVQNFAWAVKESVGWIRALIDTWREWTGQSAKITLPGVGSPQQGAAPGAGPSRDIDAEIARGNAMTRQLEINLGLISGASNKAKDAAEATKKMLKAQQDAVEAAGKAAGEAYASLLNLDAIETANQMADAFRTAQAAGAQLSRETLVEVSETMHEAIAATSRLGDIAPASFYEIRDAARAATFDLKHFAGKIGIDGIEMLQKMRESVGEATDGLKSFGDQLQDARWDNAINRQTNEVSKAFLEIGREYDQAMRKLRDTRPIAGQEKAWKALASELETGAIEKMERVVKGTDEFKAAVMAMAVVNPGLWALLPQLLGEIEDKGEGAKGKIKTLSTSIDELGDAFRDMAQTSKGGLGDFAQAMADLIQAIKVGEKAGQSMFSGWNQLTASGGGFKSMAAGAMQMAAGIMSAVSALNQATQSTSRLRNAMGGAATGASIGSAFGPWGTVAGAFIGGIYGMFKSNKPKGPTPEELHQQRLAEFAQQQAQKLQAEYDALHGRMNSQFTALIGRANELGIALPAALQASIRDTQILGQLTQENKDLLAEMAEAGTIDYRKMQEAAERYGIPLESLGQQFQQLRIDDAAQAIINDFDMLQRGGADVGTILFGMQEEISALVQEAMRFGTSIPENMRPWVDELMRAGLLVDANGDKLTDLAGLNFGDPIETAFEQITGAVQELVDAIRNELIPAFLAIPTMPTPGSPGGTPPGTTPPPPEYTPNGGDYTGYASGTMGRHGRWFKNFGGGTATVLHNDEAVVTPAQAPSFAADVLGLTARGHGGSGGGPIPVVLNIKNHRVFAELVLEETDHVLAMNGVRK